MTKRQSDDMVIFGLIIALFAVFSYMLWDRSFGDEMVSFNDGTPNLCYTVSVSPYADRETTVAALTDTATIVRRNGCANIKFDSTVSTDKHYIDLNQ